MPPRSFCPRTCEEEGANADFSAIPEDEKAFVLTLDQFLRIAKPGGYSQELGEQRGIKANQHQQTFTQFFRGKDFKPSGFSFNNFLIVGDAIAW